MHARSWGDFLHSQNSTPGEPVLWSKIGGKFCQSLHLPRSGYCGRGELKCLLLMHKTIVSVWCATFLRVVAPGSSFSRWGWGEIASSLSGLK